MEKLDCQPSRGSVEKRVMRPASRRPGSWGSSPKTTQTAAAPRHPLIRGIDLFWKRKLSQTARPKAMGAKTAVILLKVRLIAATAMAKIIIPLPDPRVAMSSKAQPINGG